MLAANRIVVHLFRQRWRLELELFLYRPLDSSGAEEPDANFVLFLGSWLAFDRTDQRAREAVEAWLRAVIDRRYARHGVAGVPYDLQIL
jgi:hypothetical protein